ncbi:hypothetical protein F443_03212 [Phytophthora nicotianae P1569]|uniref:CCHC-type domain-containing protein n=2 Tax=Phytophthora nicotianae TaxID=4792 RepID=V9FS82_PHYNI|nr:hypothetical protein F443_03212 [Phytophthora nicotianae P1569]
MTKIAQEEQQRREERAEDSSRSNEEQTVSEEDGLQDNDRKMAKTGAVSESDDLDDGEDWKSVSAQLSLFTGHCLLATDNTGAGPSNRGANSGAAQQGRRWQRKARERPDEWSKQCREQQQHRGRGRQRDRQEQRSDNDYACTRMTATVTTIKEKSKCPAECDLHEYVPEPQVEVTATTVVPKMMKKLAVADMVTDPNAVQEEFGNFGRGGFGGGRSFYGGGRWNNGNGGRGGGRGGYQGGWRNNQSSLQNYGPPGNRPVEQVKRETLCNYCFKPGHWWRECEVRIADQVGPVQQRQETQNAAAAEPAAPAEAKQEGNDQRQ